MLKSFRYDTPPTRERPMFPPPAAGVAAQPPSRFQQPPGMGAPPAPAPQGGRQVPGFPNPLTSFAAMGSTPGTPNARSFKDTPEPSGFDDERGGGPVPYDNHTPPQRGPHAFPGGHRDTGPNANPNYRPPVPGARQPITPVGPGYGPIDSPEDFYRYLRFTRHGNLHQASPERSLLPLHFFNNTPGELGHAWLSELMRNPYATNDANRRASMEGAEQAYQVAAQRMRSDSLSSGQGRGGVARGLRGQVEQARGADMARSMREHEQYVEDLGDRRLQSLLIPYMSLYNQALGITSGGPPEQGNNDLGDWAQIIAAFAELF